MPEKSGNGSSNPITPPVLAAATPKTTRSYDEPSQDDVMVEVRNLLGEMRKSFGEVTARLEAQERSSSEIKEILRRLDPQIQDVAGFVKHRVPVLADKADLERMAAGLRAEIEKRPTRRQAVFDLIWVFSFVTAAITFGSKTLR